MDRKSNFLYQVTAKCRKLTQHFLLELEYSAPLKQIVCLLFSSTEAPVRPIKVSMDLGRHDSTALWT